MKTQQHKWRSIPRALINVFFFRVPYFGIVLRRKGFIAHRSFSQCQWGCCNNASVDAVSKTMDRSICPTWSVTCNLNRIHPWRKRNNNMTRLGESGVWVGGSENANRATAPVLNSQTAHNRLVKSQTWTQTSQVKLSFNQNKQKQECWEFLEKKLDFISSRNLCLVEVANE